MDCCDVMVTVRVTTAERVLLRRLARQLGDDVSAVVADGLVDVLPMLLCERGARQMAEVLVRPAPVAVTVWLPGELADLLGPVGEWVGASPCAVLGAAVRLWLGQGWLRAGSGLRVMRAGRRRAAVPAAA
ncbi:hypothetical protein GCM10010441_60110 [Kitasatospora paracochleata]|uniref:Uncharacterized protein n=1 Tax=Kitasatospora paracochleata TaxID=58354 RepID=A0ABT1IVV3_9ACTN|nr:hypothetical protein [Kitasatospora paracochleata]MCP2309058.1 hypothetical protein [Kitasatospora paracochleata]